MSRSMKRANHRATVIIPQLGMTELTRSLVDQISRYENQILVYVLVNDQNSCPFFSNAITVYTREMNLTKCWNTGIEMSRTDHIILLNNDVTCSGPFIKSLRPGRDQVVGVKKRIEPLIRGHKVLEGWCLSFSRSLWVEIGGFDEQLQLYYSDTAFQLTAKRAGKQLNYRKCKQLSHMGQRTAHNKDLRPDRSKVYIKDKRKFKENYLA